MLRMVFTQILCRLTVGISVGLLCSCTAYRTFQVEILEPAPLQLNSGSRLALMNRNIHYEDSPVEIAKSEEELSEARLFNHFKEGMNSVMTEVRSIDTLIVLPLLSPELVSPGITPEKLAADSVRRLCAAYEADYLASIELQFYNIAKSQIISYCYLCLYQALSGIAVDSIILRHDIATVEDEMEYIRDNIIFGFWQQGNTYARRIVPSWKETKRRVYDCGKILGVGDIFFQNDQTEKALNIWESALKLSPKISIRASINMAWVYEKEGEFQKALEILQEGDRLAKDKKLLNKDVIYLRKYIGIINNRILQAQQLSQTIIPAEN